MKTNNIFRFAAMFFAAIVMVSVSACDEPMPEPESPNFPALVENYEVAPGSTLTLSFTPNYNWELSVPSETFKYFWVLDGEFKVEKLSGEASDVPITVTIGVSAEEEFDNNRSCDITMTMNGESKVIAKYMRPAKNRTLSVYSAQLDSDGNLVVGEDGESYVYGTAEAETGALVWSDATADFRLPVKVEANCEWDIEVPEWLDVEKQDKTTGVVELIFTGVSFEEASGRITFKVGETILKEIEVTIPSCKGVEVYTATMTDGEFEYGESGEYVWSETAATGVTLAWLGSDFRMPVNISSKCDWTLELPEWLTAKVVTEDGEANVPAKTAGAIKLVFKGIPSKYPLEDTEGKVKFVFKEKTLYELPINIPGCKDIMTYSIDMGLPALSYNAAGWLKTSTGYAEINATARVFGNKDIKVVAVETTGGTVGTQPAWLSVKLSAYNTASRADVLQERTVTFNVAKNTSEDSRSAVVFFLPSTVSPEPAELFNSDATVKEEYEKYAVDVLQFSSKYEDYMTESSAESGTYHTFVAADAAKKNSLKKEFGKTDHVYVLTYHAQYSKVWMNMAVPFASYKVFSSDDMTSDKSGDEAFWLQFGQVNDTNTYGSFTMYMNQELPEESTTGYVVFYDENENVLAIVECVWLEALAQTAEDIEFKDPAAAVSAGATLERLTSGDLYDEFKNATNIVVPIYHLRYTSEEHPMEVVVPVNTFKYMVNPYADRAYFKVNDTLFDTFVNNVQGGIQLVSGYITISMEMPEDDVDAFFRGNMIFYSSDGTELFLLVCTLDLSGM